MKKEKIHRLWEVDRCAPLLIQRKRKPKKLGIQEWLSLSSEERDKQLENIRKKTLADYIIYLLEE